MKGLDALGFDKPTPVQEQAIPAVMEGRDQMICAQTGSGKTAAFVLPTLHKLLSQKAPNSKTRALILVPTRELARQLHKQSEALAKFTGIEVGLITGGAEFKYQAAVLRKNPEIIVATPGRLIDHLENRSGLMDDVEVLILDEADRMLDMGFSEDVLNIAQHCREDRQTLLFSATLNHRSMKTVVAKTLKNHNVITVDSGRSEHENISQQMILADDDKHKERLLTWILANETYRQAIIFSNTKVKAQSLYHFLDYHNHKVSVLHGDMMQDERNHVMQRMRQGAVKVLVATDVAARGLDVKGIDLVINFDMGRSGDDYVHRIGRTGRAGENGLAVSLIDHTEWNLKSSIERYLQITLEPRTIKELKGSYQGPKKMKSNGKPYGKKKDKSKDKKKSGAKGNKKIASKNSKKPAKKPKLILGDGTTPFMRRK